MVQSVDVWDHRPRAGRHPAVGQLVYLREAEHGQPYPGDGREIWRVRLVGVAHVVRGPVEIGVHRHGGDAARVVDDAGEASSVHHGTRRRPQCGAQPGGDPAVWRTGCGVGHGRIADLRGRVVDRRRLPERGGPHADGRGAGRRSSPAPRASGRPSRRRRPSSPAAARSGPSRAPPPAGSPGPRARAPPRSPRRGATPRGRPPRRRRARTRSRPSCASRRRSSRRSRPSGWRG